MGKLVPTIRTTYSKEQIIKGFIEGWYQLYGSFPEKNQIAVIYAQNSIETGGTCSMWNNNVGNVKYVDKKDPNDETEYMMLANVWEIINGKKVWFQPPHPATWFRSFKTLADGVAFHFDILKNKTFKSAWVAVEKGDYMLFAKLLKDKWYYSCSLEDYQKGMKIYYDRFMKDQTFEKCIDELKNPKIIELPPIEVIGDVPEKEPEQSPQPIVNNVMQNKNTWQIIIEFIMKIFK